MARRDYGRINATRDGASYPLTVGKLIINNQTDGARYILEDFDAAYNFCKADILYTPGNMSGLPVEIRGIGFHSVVEMVAWINHNVPNLAAQFTHSCRIIIYDEVDETIPPIRRVYGKNTRMASMRRTQYYTDANYAFANGDRYGFMAVYLQKVWGHLYGNQQLNPGGTGAWNDDDFGCFWLGRSRKSFYTCPSPGLLSIELGLAVPGYLGRRMRRTVDGARVAASNETWTVDPASDTTYVLDTKSDSANTYFYDIYKGPILTYWTEDKTLMVAYPMRNGAGDRGVYMKPLGIDSLYLNWWDQTRYRLETVCSRGENETYQRLHVVDTSAAYDSPNQDSIGPIENGPLYAAACDPRKFSHRRYRPADIYFQLRDLRTNRVSAVAAPYIQWIMHRGAGTLAPLVRTKPHNN